MTEATVRFLKFHNPSQGELLFARVLEEVLKFMSERPSARYKVMIGSDSNGNRELDLVSVLAIHRVGNGGRYFWYRMQRNGIYTLRQKIYAEVEASLELAALFLPALQQEIKKRVRREDLPFDFEIHVDVGFNGETRDLVREVTGMVRGYGYEVMVKPQAPAATSFADRHT